jgi:hypothetical protein
MKKSLQVVEVENEGFMALFDEVITIFSLNYIYTGKLIGVNDTCVLLKNPSIVYETGAFTEKECGDAQKLPNQLYVQINCIESFGIIK